LGVAFFAGGGVGANANANANARCVPGASARARAHASAPASPRCLVGACFEVAARFYPHQQHSLYKTELCRSWEETGHCRYGHKCQFAHGRDELRPVLRHPKYKTEVCRTFAHGGECPYGTRCRFIHVRVPHESVLGVLEAGAHNVIPADWAPEQGGSAEREGALAQGRAEAAARRGVRADAGVSAFAENADGSNGSSGANANNNAPPREVRRARRLPVFREIAGEGEKADGDGDGDGDDASSSVRAARTRRTAAAVDAGESAARFGGVLAG
jgi:butyrate response factor 1